MEINKEYLETLYEDSKVAKLILAGDKLPMCEERRDIFWDIVRHLEKNLFSEEKGRDRIGNLFNENHFLDSERAQFEFDKESSITMSDMVELIVDAIKEKYGIERY